MLRALYQPFPMLAGSRAQVWTYSPDYRRPRHFHNEPELNLVAHGSASFGVGGSVVRLEAGDVMGFAPGQDHELLQASPDLVLFAVGLRRDLSREVLRESSFVAPFKSRLAAGTLQELVRHCAEWTGQVGADQPVAELWQRALESRRQGEADRAHVCTRRALSALDRAPELDRNQLASATRASSSEVGRYFQRDVGLTLVEYRARLRLLLFVERVDAGINLTGAALDAGFGSYSQCHRVFSATFGLTPSEFFWRDRRRAIEEAFAPAQLA